MDNPDRYKIELFKGKEVRKVFHEGEWWFSVVDVVGVISNTDRPRKYWADLKDKLSNEGYTQLSEKIGQLKMPAADGKFRETDAANAETMLRIIQTIPSPKAEPIKRWLARVGFERIEEINDPELAIKRARANYVVKGYPDEWIELRIESIKKHKDLTEEWKQRGVSSDKEYAILTAEISRATFDVTPSEHKELKGLKSEPLRDHMTPLELIFTMLGDVSTKEIAVTRDAEGFNENKIAAQDGGKIAGDARRALEKQTGKRVVSRKSYLAAAKSKNLKETSE